jgi:ubiquinone biosynthesis protein
MLRSLRHILALIRIGFTLARADALHPMLLLPGLATIYRMTRLLVPPAAEVRGLRAGQRLAWALQRLGPSFIKLGQALSTRSDLLGEQGAADLSMLQDRLPPFPFEEARKVIESELGRPLEQLYISFDPVAIAAASVAQVHFAITENGEEVAVKILRPGVAAAFARDLDMLLWLAEAIEARLPSLRRLRPVDSVKEFAQTVAFEMDLRFEAAAAAEMAENFEGDPDFRVPKVDWERTARQVLTIERVIGVSIGDREAIIAAGHDLREIIGKSARAFFAMIFRDGFFHADLHPGNLFVDAQGMVVAIDFGITGRLDRKYRNYLADMLLGFLTGNFRRVAEVHFDAGMVPPTESVAAFTQACRSIGQPLLGKPLEQISVAKLLSQLFQITRQFKMETQPELLMLQKTMVLAEGMGRHLDPSVNMWQLAQPLVEEWMAVHRSPVARVGDTVGDFIAELEHLPTLLRDVKTVLRDLSTEGLSLHTDTLNALGSGDRWVKQLSIPLWLFALAMAAIAAAMWKRLTLG